MEEEGTCLIVGLGNAGVCVHRELERRGLRAAVVDAGDSDAASGVAPGVINPLAGKRLNPSWRVEEQLPTALEAYGELEELLARRLLHRVPIIRVIKDETQREYLDRRRKSPSASAYIGQEHPPGHWAPLLRDPLGSFEASVSGYLDVAVTCQAYRDHLRARGSLIEERLEPGDLESATDGAVWRGRRYAWVIFCDGWRGRDNPWFAGLPYKPAKGEMLTLRALRPLPGFPQAIVNHGKWILPIGDGLYRAGSTYSWESFDATPTPAGAREILDGIASFVDCPFEVVDHAAGVRPILKDYRPALGTDPAHPRIALMNGLGSKGVLAAPWLARQLISHLLDGLPLYEMDVRRFWRR